MIYDMLSHFEQYIPINNLFKVVQDFVKSNDLKKLKTGENELEKGVKAIISEYETDLIENKFIECHRKYIDVQFVITGEEQIGYANIDECDILEEYNEEKDFAKLSGSIDLLTFTEGYFSILFPQDGHMPGITPTGQQNQLVKKIVFKVPV